ncbi:hypothetical protein KIN20_025989 [Parelaphostrongylus tenuis]|uniref:Uncharacterized protein n=1 Tax=Parelaphostrongylus tenuis TaxID=148309 RepID=A0AAD5NDK3_PARTN|nr:hypothetical protein KIN20_025989 [Parelaphostrongylus tenuis]
MRVDFLLHERYKVVNSQAKAFRGAFVIVAGESEISSVSSADITSQSPTILIGNIIYDRHWTRNFTVSGFKLPTAMVFTTSPGAFAQLPGGIASTSDGAKSFVSRLVMQAIIDVLERQGRSAGLSDVIISGILNQLTVQISYDPLECKTVTVKPTNKWCM